MILTKLIKIYMIYQLILYLLLHVLAHGLEMPDEKQ